jgi:hypothetical protein
MEMGVEAGAEAIEEAHSTEGDGDWNGGTGLPQGGPGGSKQEMEDGTAVGASGPSGPVGQDVALALAPELLFHGIRHAVAQTITFGSSQGQSIGQSLKPDPRIPCSRQV